MRSNYRESETSFFLQLNTNHYDMATANWDEIKLFPLDDFRSREV